MKELYLKINVFFFKKPITTFLISIGAYFAALKGLNSIPKAWIKKTEASKKILRIK